MKENNVIYEVNMLNFAVSTKSDFVLDESIFLKANEIYNKDLIFNLNYLQNLLRSHENFENVKFKFLKLKLLYLHSIKNSFKNSTISKIVNFFYIDECVSIICEIKNFFLDSNFLIQKIESLKLFFINDLKEKIYLLEKDKIDLNHLQLKNSDISVLSFDLIEIYQYRFLKLKQNKKNFLKAYLNALNNT